MRADAFPLLRQVDGVIIVGRVGVNRRDVAGRLHEILKEVEAPVLGVVANAFKAGRMGSYSYTYGYYGYGYRYGSDQQASASSNGSPPEAGMPVANTVVQPPVPQPESPAQFPRREYE